ncbi:MULTISPECIES: hypothetical protein [unclassified Streptomyces]|uniref:hypothetical protein n=1 Tax=unclassified Streptomyces TaxID=2593676 RepID=UPI002E282459|nr:hypothetical protein [Streptomyces sp. NBC_00334]
MSDHRHDEAGENAAPVPRDMPDQQAGDHDDPWEAAAPTREQREHRQGLENERPDGGDTDDKAADAGSADDVPDTDEAGTGRQGAPHSAAVHPEHPVPDESPG